MRAAALAGVLLAPPGAGQDAPEVPGAREVGDLVEEYVALDGRSAAGIARQDEILSRLEILPPLSASEAAKWAKKVRERWRKGPELEKKSGRHFLWEERRRGMYILGGEYRRPKGLLIGMHGGGEGSGDAWSSHGSLNAPASKLDWLAIFPEVLEKTERGWTDSGTEEFVLELIDRACRTWKLDRDRVYLSGHSMGGYGAWTLGAHHADLVAALAPSAGGPTPVMDRDHRILGIEPGVIPSLRNVPMVIYQSADDPQVTPDANRAAVERLKEARERWGGFDFEYWEVNGRGHGEPPGGFKALFEKIEDRRRDARPEKVVWQPVLAWKRQFYWLWWRTPVENALVEAEIDRAANAVRLHSDSPLEGLYVLLDDDLLDIDREVVVETNGAEVYRGIPPRTLAAVLLSAASGDEARTYEARVPVAP